MANQVRVGTQVTGVGKASSDLDKLRDKFEKLQKQGAKGFAIGAGAAVTAKGLSLLDSAASAAINVLGDMTEAALADEESQAKLGAALKANVPAWNGTTNAIEQVLKSRMRLGFSDDEQRQSLALLVAATQDEAKALAFQATAMDLARLKGISLKDASEALIKVEAGSFRILKSLGIELKDGATQTEALAAVQKVAAGQAEAYAETNRGKLTASTVALDEAMENLGARTMPGVVAIMTTVAGAAEGLAGDFGRLIDNTEKEVDAIGDAIETINGIISPVWAAAKAQRELDGTTRELADTYRNTEQDINTNARGIVGSTKEIGRQARSTARSVAKSLGDMADEFETTWSELSGTADQAAEDIFGPMERRADLAANRLAQGEKLGIIADPKSSRDDIAAARQDLLGLQKDFFTLTAEMAGRGELTAGELSKLTAALKDELKTASNEEAVSILNLITLLDRLRSKSKGVFVAGRAGFQVGDRAAPGSGYAGARAHGGPVDAGKTYLVNEGGQDEWLRLGSNTRGTVSPTGPSMGSGAADRWLPVIAGQLARLTAQEPAAARPMTARGDLARQAALMPGGRL